MTTAIRFDRVSKVYRIGAQERALRHALPRLARSLLGRGGTPEGELLWALREVSFEVEKGEALGIIGPNGAGKTTTLKLLSRITQPTSGRIEVNGRVSALIELGAGFHPDLTGRENIFLNAAILGLSRQETARRLDSIIAFSGLERFIDTPVKRYSSGMYVRLGFAVAAHTMPDLLLVDEVLAVGDAPFQAKCLAKIKELQDNGASIILVSHQLANVQRVCSRALLLNKGVVAIQGKTEEVISHYYQSLQRDQAIAGAQEEWPERTSERGIVSISRVMVLDDQLRERRDFNFGEDVVLRMTFYAQTRVDSPVFSISVRSTDGEVYTGYVTKFDGVEVASIQGEGQVDLVLSGAGLGAGTYEVNAGIWDRHYVGGYDWRWAATTFRVTTSEQRMMGRVHLPHYWRIVPELPNAEVTDSKPEPAAAK